MAIITAGYDGTVDETQFAEILHRYSVLGPDDFKATTQAGDRIVAISDGVALGPGTRDVATGVPSIQFAAASGTRWDLVVLRRDWQPPGGASTVVIVQGGSSKAYPAVGTAGTNWNRRPGIIDDQPLYLQEVNGTLLGQRVDLRCWAAHGGLFAKDDLVRTYLDRVGTDVNINGADWTLQLGENDVTEWIKSNSTPKVIPSSSSMVGGGQVATAFTTGGLTPIVVPGTKVVTTDNGGYFAIDYPQAFPSGVIAFVPVNGDSNQGRDLIVSAAGAPFTQTKATGFGSVVTSTGSAKANATVRINYVAFGW